MIGASPAWWRMWTFQNDSRISRSTSCIRPPITMNIVGYRNNATPDAAFGPGAESAPARRPAAAPHFQGEQLPRQPGAQHKQDAPEDLVVAHEGSPKRLAWLPFLGQLRL